MKVIQYLQVLLLLALLAYVLLLGLENPMPLRIPIPGVTVLDVPAGWVILATLLVGALYSSLIYVPYTLRRMLREYQERQRRKDLEQRLSSTVQAKLAKAERAIPTLLLPKKPKVAEVPSDDTTHPVDASTSSPS